jgi:predicted nucleic acid-binding protein
MYRASTMIIDANVATYWCVRTPLTASAKTVLSRSDLRAPALIRIETVHALLKYLRVGLITHDQFRDGIQGIKDAIHEFADDGRLLGLGTDIAIANNHPVYDCLYLALALERREPLATADRRMAALAQKLNIETQLIGPEP